MTLSEAEIPTAFACWDPHNVEYRGDFDRHWCRAVPTILEYSRSRRGALDANLTLKLDPLCKSLNGQAARGIAADLVLLSGEAGAKAANQLIALTRGLLSGVQVANQLSAWNPGSDLPEDACRSLENCLSEYHHAWNLKSPIATFVDGHPAGITSGRAAAILGRFHATLPRTPPEWWTESNWLLVHRLLSFLLDDQLLPPAWPEDRVQMLLVTKDDDGKYSGLTVPISTGVYEEGYPSPYLDPIALGVTVLDEEMLDSLRIAARICRPPLARGSGLANGRSLRISPQPGLRNLLVLQGDSAGGLVTLAAYASASGEKYRLNRNSTASFALQVQESQRERLLPEDIRLGPVDSECIEAKLQAACEDKLTQVFLHGSQSSGPPGAESPWRDWVPRLRLKVHVIPVGPTTDDSLETGPGDPSAVTRSSAVATLLEMIDLMTGDERMERAVATVAAQSVEDWKIIRAGQSADTGENHHLDLFIPPGVSIVAFDEDLPDTPGTTPDWAIERKPRRDAKRQQRRRKSRRRFPVKGGFKTLLNHFFMNKNRRLVVTEDAGAGKTVVSWWIRALLCNRTNPCLVVRHEGVLPEDLRGSLESVVREACVQNGVNATDLIGALLQQRRIVVILDALDQASPETVKQLEHLDKLGSEHELSRLRWIVTSRSHAVAAKRSNLFRAWQMARIELFGPKRREAYRQQLFARHERYSALWQQLIPDESAVADLIRFPLVLQMVRELVQEAARNGSRLKALRNRGDLYWRISQLLMERAFKKTEREMRAGDLPGLVEVTACFGIEMMLTTRKQFGFRVPSGLIRRVKQDARRRFLGSEDEWNRCLELLQDTHFTDRSMLLSETGVNPELSFRSLKMMEFAAGVYLAQFATTSIRSELAPQVGDSLWYWPFRFALELPSMRVRRSEVAAFRREALINSIVPLFRRPEENVRPTELMYRAAMMFQDHPEMRADWNDILTEYRQQFLEILRGTDPTRARRAAELLTDDDVQSLVATGQTGAWTFEQLRPDPAKFPTYHLCCDAKNPEVLSFWMGEGKPADWHAVTTPSFHMAPTCVTRAQHRLFDPRREHCHSEGGYSIKAIAPEEDCPMIYLNFFDAWCLALWLGDNYRLPSEVEWEGAAWGGIDRKCPEHLNSVIGVPPYNDSFTSDQVNFNGNQPLSHQKSASLQRTLPVRWDQTRRAAGLTGKTVDLLPKEYQPNGFQLWHMSGNVWEWCRTPWYSELADSLRDNDSANSRFSDLVCVRGGSWIYVAWYSPCSFRYRIAPVNRNYDIGVRLTRTK
ncbi:MAG: SUMF1/EgtB/PvdO family nonheme iron enzyme [Planctomycetes bacterium]|nr:SUMF1/EgtB/PvdO family nonheme iron enzyme [Planctomycetota bacterium]